MDLKPKIGRPTTDPKTVRVTIRLAPRDFTALRKVAATRKVPLAEAARDVLREALKVPPSPSKRSSP